MEENSDAQRRSGEETARKGRGVWRRYRARGLAGACGPVPVPGATVEVLGSRVVEVSAGAVHLPRQTKRRRQSEVITAELAHLSSRRRDVITSVMRDGHPARRRASKAQRVRGRTTSASPSIASATQ